MGFGCFDTFAMLGIGSWVFYFVALKSHEMLFVVLLSYQILLHIHQLFLFGPWTDLQRMHHLTGEL